MFRWRDAKGTLLSGPNNETLSNNWSGYGINGGGTDTTVQGSWTVPAVSYQSYSGSPDVEASSTWIGVGGQDGDETLIQIGTMQAAAPNGIIMKDPNGNAMSMPSDPDGDSFTVKFTI
jgi:hypothetical protein